MVLYIYKLILIIYIYIYIHIHITRDSMARKRSYSGPLTCLRRAALPAPYWTRPQGGYARAAAGVRQTRPGRPRRCPGERRAGAGAGMGDGL